MTVEAELLRAAMDAQGITDPVMRAGIAAIAMGESALSPRSEAGYGGTSNSRIRQIFGARVAPLTDAELTAAKANDQRFFELVYGGQWGAKNLGNTQPGDGYRYRGRGIFQLTGRGNYAHYGKLIGEPSLEASPDLANDMKIAALIAVAYMRSRYTGGGWEGMKRAVGNSVGNVDRRKNALFQEYLASGEYAASAPQTKLTAAGPAGAEAARILRLIDPPMTGPDVDEAVDFLNRWGIDPPLTSTSYDADVEDAVRIFQKETGLSVDGIVGTVETWPALRRAAS